MEDRRRRPNVYRAVEQSQGDVPPRGRRVAADPGRSRSGPMTSPEAALNHCRKKRRCRETGSAVGIAATIANHQRGASTRQQKISLGGPDRDGSGCSRIQDPRAVVVEPLEQITIGNSVFASKRRRLGHDPLVSSVGEIPWEMADISHKAGRCDRLCTLIPPASYCGINVWYQNDKSITCNHITTRRYQRDTGATTALNNVRHNKDST